MLRLRSSIILSEKVTIKSEFIDMMHSALIITSVVEV